MKRASPDGAHEPRKRQKKVIPVGSDDELSSAPSDLSEPENRPKRAGASTKPVKASPTTVARVARSQKSESVQDPDETNCERSKEAAATPKKDNQSESEMSVVIDEGPKPKRRRQKETSDHSKQSKASKVAPPKSKEVGNSPDETEIKRLQGWLVKCGIRKMWFKELAPYDTPKAKIKHLKQMLADAGMGGRFSEEKARRIREERELKADLEAVQEGDKMWGQDKSEEEVEDPGKPRRRRAKALQMLDFLTSDEGSD